MKRGEGVLRFIFVRLSSKCWPYLLVHHGVNPDEGTWYFYLCSSMGDRDAREIPWRLRKPK